MPLPFGRRSPFGPLYGHPRPFGPTKGWRQAALAAYDSGGSATWVTAMTSASLAVSPSLTLADGATRTVAVKVPAGGPYIWSFVEGDTCSFTATTSTSYDSTTGATNSGTWSAPEAVSLWHVPTTGSHNPANGQKITIPSDSSPRWVNLVLTAGGAAGNGVALVHWTLHYLSAIGTLDYWLVIGASLEERGSSPSALYPKVRAVFSDRDPLIFNRAQESLTSEEILALLPTVLAEHPRASYVILHSGGNDVSNTRLATGPLQASIDATITNLTAMADLIVAAGMTPIIGRISFRDYHTDAAKKVNGGRNPYAGSWPWNGAIDTLRATYCPGFDFDPYIYSRTQPGVISTDGVHWPWPDGWGCWQDMLVEQCFAGAYQGAPTAVRTLPKHVIVDMSGNTNRNSYCGNRLRSTLNSTVSLQTVEGVATGWTATTTDAPTGEGNSTGYQTGSNTGAFIDTIMYDNHYVDGTNTAAEYTLSGLDKSKRYTLKVFGTRAVVAADRITTYTVTGGVVGAAAWTASVNLDCANNSANTADFYAVPPTVTGKITIGVTRNAGSTFGYITCIEVIEH